MADNFNISLPGAAQGAADVMDLGPGVAAAASKTMQDQQAVEQAVERTKQSQMQTQLEEAGGLAAEKGLVPKAQAISSLRIALKNNGAGDDEINQAIDDAQQTWPDPVSSAVVDRLVWTLRPKTVSRIGEGNPFPAVGNEQDANGNPIPKGTMIQEVLDNEGNTTYIHSAVPSGVQSAEVRADATGNSNDNKIWSGKIVPALDINRASSRSANGIAARAIVLGTRGLALLSQPTLTYQNMQEVTRELDSIVRGGVATNAGASELIYNTLKGDMQQAVQYLSGEPTDSLSPGLKQQLQSSFDRIIANSRDLVESEFKFYEAAYPQVMQNHQNEVLNMKNAVLHPSMTNMQQFIQGEQPARTPGFLGSVGHHIGGLIDAIMGGNKIPNSPNLPTTGPSGDGQEQTSPAGTKFTVNG